MPMLTHGRGHPAQNDENMETAKFLIRRLKDEQEHKISGGIYNLLQVEMAYNSNHMEGSQLTHEQTRYIFETHSIEGPARTDDIVETINHFRCLDYVIDHYTAQLSETFIKELHFMLKNGTFSAQSEEAVVGDYKHLPNYAGDIRTSSPKSVHSDISALLESYYSDPGTAKSLEEIIGFHADFERIHPFYDGNGRVGRLIMFKECLANDIIPFVIRDDAKYYYIRELHEWQTGGEKGYLMDTCLSMQDRMKAELDYFQIPYEMKSDRV